MWWFSGRELAHDLGEQRLVIGDQLALGAALLRIAEDVERRAAQELELRQQRNAGSIHGPKVIFFAHARDRVLAARAAAARGGI